MSKPHAVRTHKRLSLSGAYGWQNCAGRANLLATIPEQKPNAAMLEGTRAHEWCEYLLNTGTDAKAHIGLTINGGGEKTDRPLTEEMATAVQVYLNFVREVVASDPGSILLVERTFDLKEVDEDVGGTTDAGVWLPETATVHGIDYKHGVGSFVDVDGNDQLTGYGYGLWQEFRHLGVSRVLITIVQPRCHGEAIRTVEIDIFELMDWSLKAEKAAKATRAPNAPCTPGPWCAKTFCRGRAHCKPFREQAENAAVDGFGAIVDPTKLQADNIGERLRKLPEILSYCKALKEFADAEAAAGRMPPGWKFVAGRGSRGWSPELSEQDVAKRIRGITNACAPFDQKLISPAAAETAMGKKTFAMLADIVKKSAGKPTLAPIEDKRPALDTASVDGFEPLTEESENE